MADGLQQLRLTHVGGPTVLVEVAGWRILTDPTFDPPGERYHFGWGTASTKTTGPALAADELGEIDAVLLTHDHHADNLDTAGRALLADVPTVITTSAGARRLGGETIGLEPWASIRLDPGGVEGRETIEITATPCRHGPPLSRPIVGDVVGFALGGLGEQVVWISGDTVLHRDLWQVPDRLDVGVALIHLGGVRFPVTGPLRYTMTIDEAVQLCERLDAHTVIPVHYEGWSHFRQGRAPIEDRLATAPAQVKDAFRFLDPGQPTTVDL